MTRFIIALCVIIVASVSGCVSTDQIKRPEITLERAKDGTLTARIETTYWTYTDQIEVLATSIDGKKTIPCPADHASGKLGGDSFLYEAAVDLGQIDSVGSQAIISIKVQMADNGVVLRQYFVKSWYLQELNPLRFDSELQDARFAYTGGY